MDMSKSHKNTKIDDFQGYMLHLFDYFQSSVIINIFYIFIYFFDDFFRKLYFS